MRLLLVLCTLLCLTAECRADRTVEGLVRTVYDGDTLLLETRDGTRLKTRLYGIDAPEIARPDRPGQPFGEAAGRALGSKVTGKRVTAQVVDIDRYQRVVAVVRIGSRDINREMLTEGMAWAYRRYLQPPYASAYTTAESGARARRTGLWRDSRPQPPWEFRELQRGGHHRRWHR